MASTTPPSDKQRYSRTKRGAVCMSCRQLKQQCDAAELAPAPCTRCSKFGRNCSIDPSFRRIQKRSRVSALERQLAQTENELLRYKEATLSAPGPTTLQEPLPTLSPGVPSHCIHITDQVLEEVKLGNVDIISLIENYYATFHPQFPILPDAATFISRYNANKLLLWSIMAVSAGASPETASLYNSLVNPVRRLAGDIYSHQSQGLGAVQGLLLLCAWPFPYQQTVNDPSPMYAALATNLAYQLGLHRPPALHADFSYHATRHEENLDDERERAWYGCFVINYTIATRLGIPSTTSIQSIMSEIAAGRSSTLPDILMHLLHISYFGHKTTTLLGDGGSVPSGLINEPLRYIQLLDNDLRCMHESFKNQLSRHGKIFYLATRLMLYSYAFNSDDILIRANHSVFDETEVTGKATSAATELLQLAGEDNATTRWPAFMRNCVIYATVLVAAMIARTIRTPIEVSSLMKTCQGGNSLIQSWSLFPKDNYSRISTHISRFVDVISLKALTPAIDGQAQQIWPNEVGGRDPVTSRMSANVLFNVIWPAKRAAANMANLAPGIDKQQENMATLQSVEDSHAGQTFVNLDEAAYNDFGPTDNFQDLEIFDDIFADWSDLVGNVT